MKFHKIEAVEASLNHVFLTHAHGDHARCLMRHYSLRKMMGVERESTYYMPERICEGARNWIHAEAMFEGVPDTKFRYPEIVPVNSGDLLFLEHRKDLAFEAFEVRHAIYAMGGTLYHYKKKLKDEGLRFSNLLLEERMRVAVNMLCSRHGYGQAVAEKCGYSSRSYFISVFHRYYGFPPDRYVSMQGLDF